MKIATTSATFAGAIASGEFSQLEWLDLAANELEADAVVFDAAQFARTDDEYCAQLKKAATDLGLCVAAVEADALLADGGEAWLGVAVALGAPLAIVRAPQSGAGPTAWGAFAHRLQGRAKEAKGANVTLALRNDATTLVATVEDAKRIAKDVDSAWLRFALDPAGLGALGDPASLLSEAVLAVHRVAALDRFAQDEDAEAEGVIRSLARFRGCVLLETHDVRAARGAYHGAFERFAALRAHALATP